MTVRRPRLSAIKAAALSQPDYDASNLADELVDATTSDDPSPDETEQRFDVYYWTMDRIREFRERG